MEIRWNDTPRKTWDEAVRLAAWQQCWAYGAMLDSRAHPVNRAAIVEEGETVGYAQFTGRRFFGCIHVSTCTRGPVWLHEVPEAVRRQAYRALCDTIPLPWPRGIFFTPDASGEDDALRGARFRQVMSPYSTAILDLTTPDDELMRAMHGKWRNRLRRAEDAGFKVTVAPAKPGTYDWFLEQETAQQRRRRYVTMPPALVPAWQAQASGRDSVMLATATRGSETIGAMLFLIHGAGALYQYGMANAAGRAANAHNLLLWRALRVLRKRGVQTLDLGGLDTVDCPGIARFKLGSGARVRTLCGTWC